MFWWCDMTAYAAIKRIPQCFHFSDWPLVLIKWRRLGQSFPLTINPFTAPACRIYVRKSTHITYRPANSTFDSRYRTESYNESTVSTPSPVHFDRNPFLCSCEGGKGLNDFRSGAFTGHFQSDSEESTAVKGLSCWSCLQCFFLMKLTLCIQQHFMGLCLGHFQKFHCGLHFNFDFQWWVSIVIIVGSWKTDILCCTVGLHRSMVK